MADKKTDIPSDASRSRGAAPSRFRGSAFQRRASEDDTVQLEGETTKWRKRLYAVWTVIGACLLIWVFGWLLNIFAQPVGILIWCLVLVFCLRPVVNALEAKGVKRGLGTFIAFVFMFVLLAILAWLLFSPDVGLGAQFAALNSSLPFYADQVTGWLNALGEQYASILENPTVQGWISTLADSFYSFIAGFAGTAASSVVDISEFIASSFFVIGFAVVISFWVLMELPGIKREIGRFIDDDKREDAAMLDNTLTSVIGGYIKGTLLQCFLIGLTCGIGYAVVGLPSAAALGIITGLLNIIPVVGPWLGGALAAAAGIIVNPTAAIAALVIAIVVQQVVYTFVSPLIMSDAVDVHPALVLFGLVCGGAVGGAMAGFSGSILGMLASIPLIAAAKALFVYYYEKNTGKQIVSPDGVLFQGTVEKEAGAVNPGADATAPLRFTKNRDAKDKYPERRRTAEERERERRKRRERKAGKTDSPHDRDDENG